MSSYECELKYVLKHWTHVLKKEKYERRSLDTIPELRYSELINVIYIAY